MLIALYHHPGICQSFAEVLDDRCDSLGSCKPQLYFYNLIIFLMVLKSSKFDAVHFFLYLLYSNSDILRRIYIYSFLIMKRYNSLHSLHFSWDFYRKSFWKIFNFCLHFSPTNLHFQKLFL
jgi:hypothetical protein